MPLHLQILPPPVPNPKIRYRFENLWLCDAHCREVMIESWSKSHGYTLMDRVGRCGKAIWIRARISLRTFSDDWITSVDEWSQQKTDGTNMAYLYSMKHMRNTYGFYSNRVTTGANV
nr:uncharacterized protein LOC109167502 [Ipomoea batatas]